MRNPFNIYLLREDHPFRYWLTVGAGIVVGLIFVTSGIGKLLGQSAFLLNILLPVPLMPTVLATIIADWLPWVELILGVCLIMGVAAQVGALLSTVLVAVFITYNSWMIGNGLGYRPCGCLGVLDKVFLGELSTTQSLYIDIGLLILALIIYFGYQGGFFDVRPWFLRRLGWQMPKEGEVDR